MDESETDDPSLVGEVCHIVAESEDGPRGKSPLTKDERNKYSNLILMCCVHHKLIDDQPTTYSIEVLHEIKRTHEEFVRISLNEDGRSRQRAEEVVAGYIDTLAEKSDIENWNAWTSWLSSPQPSISAAQMETLKTIPEWLLSRIWPKGFFPQLEKAMGNFRAVLNGFLNVFKEHSERLSDDTGIYMYITKKFYKIDEWNEERYFRLGREYDCHVALILDYAYELTRAANYVCDSIRLELLPNFRLEEGALLVTRGMDMNLRYHTYRPEYRAVDFPDLYLDEEDFNRRRLTRDVYEGTTEEASFLEERMKLRRFPQE
jgi:hypothetical protein